MGAVKKWKVWVAREPRLTASWRQTLSCMPVSCSACFATLPEMPPRHSCLQILESQLEKKAGINYAPPANKQLIYFVDDLNLPRLDAYETAMVGGWVDSRGRQADGWEDGWAAGWLEG